MASKTKQRLLEENQVLESRNKDLEMLSSSLAREREEYRDKNKMLLEENKDLRREIECSSQTWARISVRFIILISLIMTMDVLWVNGESGYYRYTDPDGIWGWGSMARLFAIALITICVFDGLKIFPLLISVFSKGSISPVVLEEKTTDKTERDRERQKFLEKAEQDNAYDQYILAELYFRGHGGFERDVEKAIYWCEKAIEQNYVPAQCMRGIMYAWEGDIEKAHEYYLKAIEQTEKEDDPKRKVKWQIEASLLLDQIHGTSFKG